LVVDDEYALISAGESRDVNPLRTGRYRVREQVAQNKTEGVRRDRELAGDSGDDFGVTVTEVGDRLLQALRESRRAGAGLIRAHCLEDRVDELECAHQSCTRIRFEEGTQERRLHVVGDEAREVVECLGLARESRYVLDKLFLGRGGFHLR